ncbi:type II toxin-antitoxin system HicA family toxin [Helicobacter pylori]|uniref:type II toxin-antitoxin system HicA family toxin n=1 Tax=Helicobacter pylori TaxID=210 RepID=UPI0002BC12BF|nr:type II toxin-antitoxin system HicA family toxin [Helicobacter pylori]EMH01415.1 toxin-antitoxin system, toxin component, HicA family [Helicobacter pylori GAM210Bi]MDO7807663.1 type II toxin-antitoxin system HicA family toxin [Helicobacter pylori]MUU26458.1 addiction module toxin, HicA family [Helicobacter pylori]MUU66286.1 addiction module toxin, HicA family [Helicobacter pylori]WQS41064.1 type II toxin-antitoxin system HicA family toxin [Helicobacter pylori]
MPELPRLTAKEAEKLLLQNGFILSRQKGSHRIYVKDKIRQVLLFHSGGILHPKIVKEIMENTLK